MRLQSFLIFGVFVATVFPPAQAGRATARPAVQSPNDPYEITTVCTAIPVLTGRRVAVSNGGELQRALDGANAGDTILLAPGGTFEPPSNGSFILRNRRLASGQWIVIRSASTAFEPGGALPPHSRVSEANAAEMPHIRATTNAPAIRAEAGARGYRLIGLDVGVDAGVRQVTNLVELGNGSDVTADTEPSDIVIDRCYLHGNDVGNFRRGVLMNGVRLAVIDSHVDNFHDGDTDSQAVGGANGPGPFKIVNNFLEAAGENVMFGGSDPSIPDLVPRDIEVRRNVMTKRLAWQAARVAVKNAFELKNASRVIVEANTFENVWVSGQDGSAIVFKSANQDGRCTWCVTEYVTFRNNIVRGAAHGVTINAAETGAPRAPLPPKAHHIRIDNVLFENIGGSQWGGGGKLFRIFGGVADVSITHVTSRSNATGILDPAGDDSNPRFAFKYNIVERRNYGIGTGSDEGTRTLARNFNPYSYGYNVVVNTSASTDQAISNRDLESRYPARTWVVTAWTDVGFDNGTSRLGAASRFTRAGDDGRDIGADVDAITRAQASGTRVSDGCGEPRAVPR